MFVEIRRQGKKRKFYLVHSYREKGKSKRISRYLGSNLNEETLGELQKRAERHLLSKIKERSILEFELTSEEITEFKKYERKIEITHLQIPDWKHFTENFTYNTNAIEGSTVARAEVKELLEQKEKPRNQDEVETINVAQAVDYIRTSTETVSLAFLRKLHSLCFAGTKIFAGTFRKVEVVIRDSQGRVVHQGVSVHEVELFLKRLCQWYNAHNTKYPPLLLAALMHNEFERIHPFQDGNGRVGRLLLNYVLLRHRYPPINITLTERSRYYHCLQRYGQKNDIKSTVRFLAGHYKRK